VCAAADTYWHAPNLVVFFAQVLITLPVYAACTLIVFRGDVRNLYLRWQNSRPVQAESSSVV